MLLAIGACYTNDLYREAAKKGIPLGRVSVDVEGDWGGDPVRAQNVSFSINVESSAPEADVLALVRHTDEVAEVHNSLRLGTKVTLARVEALSND